MLKRGKMFGHTLCLAIFYAKYLENLATLHPLLKVVMTEQKYLFDTIYLQYWKSGYSKFEWHPFF